MTSLPERLNRWDPDNWVFAIEWLARWLASWDRPVTIVSGMALGFDLILAIAAIRARDEMGADVRLVAAVPFEGQERKWVRENPKAVAAYKAAWARADEVFVLFPDDKNRALNRCNCWMVDQSEHVLAFWNGLGVPYAPGNGGTAHCVDYAISRFRPITNLHAPFSEIFRRHDEFTGFQSGPA
jgi:hypothetical protein